MAATQMHYRCVDGCCTAVVSPDRRGGGSQASSNLSEADPTCAKRTQPRRSRHNLPVRGHNPYNMTPFNNEKYIRIQSEHIKERIAQFGNKLYLELGGKLFDDFHASRVLPGF